MSADDYTPTTAEVEADWLNWQSMLAEDSDVEANSRAVIQWRRWLQGELARAWDEGALWRHHAPGVHSKGLLWWQVGYPSEPVNAPNPYREGSQ